MQEFDLVVIGGGINGAGVARDASGRGLSVLLCEKDDLAQATSSSSTKLIHGGLRYLEFFHFNLVRESLREREILLNSMPHIIWPLRFILPHHNGLRPAWLLRLGLFLYDHIGGRKLLPATKKINLKNHESGNPLKKNFSVAFEYSDCWVEDSRMVILNAKDAKLKGATIKTHTSFENAKRKDDLWEITLRDNKTSIKKTIISKSIVNCAGPWVTNVIGEKLNEKNDIGIRLIKGSHVITKKLFKKNHNYIFQNSDGRIVFAIPYESDFTLIGTTDIEYEGDPGEVRCSLEEKKYLVESVSNYLSNPVSTNDIVHTYSGVRPLFNDNKTKAQNVTRDYVIKTNSQNRKAPLINVFGGKITTYRILAEKVMNELKPYFSNLEKKWTKNSNLPGGNFNPNEFDELVKEIMDKYKYLDKKWAIRLLRAYGKDSFDILNNSLKIEDLGINFGWNLTEKEILWMVENEFAETTEDILWRRSKLGLRFSHDQVKYLENWLKDNIKIHTHY
tara:strand:- start:792 stop:2303 length:1512 start_codon:yes stop_codon:yes gene_type:complete